MSNTNTTVRYEKTDCSIPAEINRALEIQEELRLKVDEISTRPLQKWIGMTRMISEASVLANNTPNSKSQVLQLILKNTSKKTETEESNEEEQRSKIRDRIKAQSQNLDSIEDIVKLECPESAYEKVQVIRGNPLLATNRDNLALIFFSEGKEGKLGNTKVCQSFMRPNRGDFTRRDCNRRFPDGRDDDLKQNQSSLPGCGRWRRKQHNQSD